MTPEQRETLAQELERVQLALRAFPKAAGHYELAEALRAALAPPPTCGTCRWLRHIGAKEDDTEPACAHESEAHPLHWCRPVGNPETFGCTYHKEAVRG